MANVEEILEAVGEVIGGVASGDAVVGSAVQLGGVTVYPLSVVSMGVGGAGGQGENDGAGEKAKAGAGSGLGAGGGVRARPVAVIVFQEGEITVLPVPHKAGPLGRLLEGLPDLIARLKEKGTGKA